MPVGVGNVSLAFGAAVPIAIEGAVTYTVQGRGRLSFYAPATITVAVSGSWESFSAALSGNATLWLTSDSLTLNGVLLPAGTYTIITNAAVLTGSGATSSPNFTGELSINATDATVGVVPGTGNVTLGGSSLDPTTGFTLNGYTGTIDISADPGSDTVALNGNEQLVWAADLQHRVDRGHLRDRVGASGE
jgi:hypothetical protein